MRRYFLILQLVALMGCADTYLDKQESSLKSTNVIDARSSLEEQSKFALEMSRGYSKAARSTSNAQDVASFGVFLAAATAVTGAIGSASDVTIANRAVAGAAIEGAARRTVPMSAIKAIYVGAKRLNCISTMSAVGVQLLSDQDSPTKLAARAITFGAINEVMISTRDGLTREIADYGALVTEFTDASSQLRSLTVGRARAASGAEVFDIDLINKYLALISNCVASGSQENAAIPN
jgi:hypothetical protein